MEPIRNKPIDIFIQRVKTLVEEVKENHPDMKKVCICGSSRFCGQIAVIKWGFEKNGIWATGLNLLPGWYIEHAGWMRYDHGGEEEGVADVLDKLHRVKIDEADVVIVCNVDGYVGAQTYIEIQYSEGKKKPIYFLEK